MSTKHTRSKKVTEQVARFYAVSKQLKQLQEEYDSLRNSLLQYMGDDKELVAGDYTISKVQYSSKRLDSTLLKEQEPEMYETYSRMTECTRLMFK